MSRTFLGPAAATRSLTHSLEEMRAGMRAPRAAMGWRAVVARPAQAAVSLAFVALLDALLALLAGLADGRTHPAGSEPDAESGAMEPTPTTRDPADDEAAASGRGGVSARDRMATGRSEPAQPNADQPVADQPPVEQPTLDQPTGDQPTGDHPTADQPMMGAVSDGAAVVCSPADAAVEPDQRHCCPWR